MFKASRPVRVLGHLFMSVLLVGIVTLGLLGGPDEPKASPVVNKPACPACRSA